MSAPPPKQVPRKPEPNLLNVIGVCLINYMTSPEEFHFCLLYKYHFYQQLSSRFYICMCVTTHHLCVPPHLSLMCACMYKHTACGGTTQRMSRECHVWAKMPPSAYSLICYMSRQRFSNLNLRSKMGLKWCLACQLSWPGQDYCFSVSCECGILAFIGGAFTFSVTPCASIYRLQVFPDSSL